MSQIGGESSVLESLAANKKRESKAAIKSSSAQSEISRSSSGRFEATYKAGDKLGNRAIKKQVNEDEWEFVEKRGGRDWYICKKC